MRGMNAAGANEFAIDFVFLDQSEDQVRGAGLQCDQALRFFCAEPLLKVGEGELRPEMKRRG